MLFSHESRTFSPTYLVIFDERANQEKIDFSEQITCLSGRGINSGFLPFVTRFRTFPARLSSQSSIFTEKRKNLEGNPEERRLSSGIIKQAQGCPSGTIPEPAHLCQFGWEKVFKISGTKSSDSNCEDFVTTEIVIDNR